MSQQESQAGGGPLQRLFAAARSSAQSTGAEQVEAIDFDWFAPQHFTRDQLERLSEFAQELAGHVSRSLTATLHSEVIVQSDQVGQYYGQALTESVNAAGSYAGSILDAEGNACGLIVMPSACASGWVSQLLGVPAETSDGQRELSGLETDLLADVMAAVVKGLSRASQQAGGGKFSLDQKVVKDQLPLPGGDASEFCKITFQQVEVAEDQAMPMILQSDALDGICQEKGVGDQGGDKAIDTRSLIIEHLQKATVTATAWLGEARASMKDILAMEPGDVLLLQRKMNEPIDLEVKGRYVLSGLPVAFNENYALQVVTPAGQRPPSQNSESQKSEEA